MTFTTVLLICIAGITLCAVLVFAVETLVAFCLHEQDRSDAVVVPAQPRLVKRLRRDLPVDRAA